jgi:hypothetical protein
VKSATHSWLGRSAWNCRFTRSSGHGALASGTVVRTDLPSYTAQPGHPHQPLDGAARNLQALAQQLAPDLVGAIDLQVLVEHTLHLGQQQGIALGPLWPQRR